MLSALHINGLKSIDNIEINLRKLNLFTGINSAGKSSAIQAILLLVQNLNREKGSPLNGHLVSLGDFREVRNHNTKAEEIKIGMRHTDNSEISAIFKENDKNNEDTCIVEFDKYSEKLAEFLNYDNNNVYYISSSRIGYQDIYNKNIEKIDKFGLQGEYAIYYYNKHKSDVLESCMIKGKDSNTLEGQLNYWFNYILNARLNTEELEGTDKVKARYSTGSGRLVRPKNIGSGLSYLISILIVCLCSKKEDIIIIENPEIHLHPKAQSRLSSFMTFAAMGGRQMIVETHSDHIFNGIRVSLAQNTLKKEEVCVNFFTLNDRFCTVNTEIEFGTNGRIVNSQKGLFDQFDDDLDKMLGI